MNPEIQTELKEIENFISEYRVLYSRFKKRDISLLNSFKIKDFEHAFFIEFKIKEFLMFLERYKTSFIYDTQNKSANQNYMKRLHNDIVNLCEGKYNSQTSTDFEVFEFSHNSLDIYFYFENNIDLIAKLLSYETIDGNISFSENFKQFSEFILTYMQKLINSKNRIRRFAEGDFENKLRFLNDLNKDLDFYPKNIDQEVSVSYLNKIFYSPTIEKSFKKIKSNLKQVVEKDNSLDELVLIKNNNVQEIIGLIIQFLPESISNYLKNRILELKTQRDEHYFLPIDNGVKLVDANLEKIIKEQNIELQKSLLNIFKEFFPVDMMNLNYFNIVKFKNFNLKFYQLVVEGFETGVTNKFLSDKKYFGSILKRSNKSIYNDSKELVINASSIEESANLANVVFDQFFITFVQTIDEQEKVKAEEDQKKEEAKTKKKEKRIKKEKPKPKAKPKKKEATKKKSASKAKANANPKPKTKARKQGDTKREIKTPEETAFEERVNHLRGTFIGDDAEIVLKTIKSQTMIDCLAIEPDKLVNLILNEKNLPLPEALVFHAGKNRNEVLLRHIFVSWFYMNFRIMTPLINRGVLIVDDFVSKVLNNFDLSKDYPSLAAVYVEFEKVLMPIWKEVLARAEKLGDLDLNVLRLFDDEEIIEFGEKRGVSSEFLNSLRLNVGELFVKVVNEFNSLNIVFDLRNISNENLMGIKVKFITLAWIYENRSVLKALEENKNNLVVEIVFSVIKNFNFNEEYKTLNEIYDEFGKSLYSIYQELPELANHINPSLKPKVFGFKETNVFGYKIEKNLKLIDKICLGNDDKFNLDEFKSILVNLQGLLIDLNANNLDKSKKINFLIFGKRFDLLESLKTNMSDLLNVWQHDIQFVKDFETAKQFRENVLLKYFEVFYS